MHSCVICPILHTVLACTVTLQHLPAPAPPSSILIVFSLYALRRTSLTVIIIMKKFIALEVLLALIVVIFTLLLHRSEGVVQISDPVRAQRSVYYHSRGERNFGSSVVMFSCMPELEEVNVKGSVLINCDCFLRASWVHDQECPTCSSSVC